MIDNAFGNAGNEVVIEELLIGEECSLLAFSDGKTVKVMPAAQDHKRIFDDDKGPNTGGMGAYSPVPWLPEDADKQVKQKIIKPLLAELKKRQINYTGFLYCGLMWTKFGPFVVEFNVRLGDPEAQVLVTQDSRDWLQMIMSSHTCRCCIWLYTVLLDPTIILK